MSRQKLPDLPVPGNGVHVAIVAARYNEELVDNLVFATLNELSARGVAEEDVSIFRVPGVHEIPYTASMVAKLGDHDVVLALGVVIAGETNHHELLAHVTGVAFQQIGLHTEIPVVNGVLVVKDEAQAQARIGEPYCRGREFAQTAIIMGLQKQELVARLNEREQQEMDADLGWEDDRDKDNPWKL